MNVPISGLNEKSPCIPKLVNLTTLLREASYTSQTEQHKTNFTIGVIVDATKQLEEPALNVKGCN